MLRTAAVSSLTLAALFMGSWLSAADENSSVQSSQPTADPASATQAKEKSPKHAGLFAKLDANHDGQLSADEVPEEHRRLFERLLRQGDKNGDGKLSRDEFITDISVDHTHQPVADQPGGDHPKSSADRPGPKGPPMVERGFGFGRFAGAGQGKGPGAPMLGGPVLFKALDRNGDGQLDTSEIAAAAEALKKLDKDGDGNITREEIMQAFPGAGAFGAGLGGIAGSPSGGFGAGENKDGFSPEASMKHLLERMDANHDGKFQKEELPPRIQEHFDDLDANHDGVLDDSEMKSVMARMIRRLQQEHASAAGPASDKK